MKKVTTILIITALIFSACSRSVVPGRPQVIYKVNDSSFIIKGNSLHFQQRADYKARKKMISKN